MTIDDKFQHGIRSFVENFRQGIVNIKKMNYDEALKYCLDAEKFALVLLESDPETSRLFAVDKLLLAARGYQMKIYGAQLECAEDPNSILDEMRVLARGEFDDSNHYFVEMMRIVEELNSDEAYFNLLAQTQR